MGEVEKLSQAATSHPEQQTDRAAEGRPAPRPSFNASQGGVTVRAPREDLFTNERRIGALFGSAKDQAHAWLYACSVPCPLVFWAPVHHKRLSPNEPSAESVWPACTHIGGGANVRKRSSFGFTRSLRRRTDVTRASRPPESGRDARRSKTRDRSRF